MSNPTIWLANVAKASSNNPFAASTCAWVEIGESGTDFVENQKTVLCETRGVLAVMDSGAAITGNFSTDKAALETA